MFLTEAQLIVIKGQFEEWKVSSELYPKRLRQIAEFVPIAEQIISYATYEPITNIRLTALIQTLKANASRSVLDKYLPMLVTKDKDLELVRGELSMTEQRGFTGAGKAGIAGLNERQLQAVSVLLKGAQDVSTQEEAIRLVQTFETENIPLVKSGIFSPWLYYLKPDLFPITNESHKEFRSKHAFPEAYSERMPAYWQVAAYIKSNLGELDAFIYGAGSSEVETPQTIGKEWYQTKWMRNVKREHWEHFLDSCERFIDQLEIEPEDPILGLTPRTDSARRISLNLGNRLVFGLEHKEETRAIIMLEPDAGKRFPDLEDWGNFGSLPEAHLWDMPYQQFLVLGDDALSECLTLSAEYRKGKGSSSYRKYHEPDLFRMVVDRDFRASALDHMLNGKGEWPGTRSTSPLSMADGMDDTDIARQYYKYSPGAQAHLWKTCFKQGIAMVGHRETIGFDMTPLTSQVEVNRAAGLDDDDKGNKAWNLWLFRNAKPGDVFFASKGKNQCVGIGIVRGDYYFAGEDEEYPHRRDVEWITKETIEHKEKDIPGVKALFRFDTFSPAKAWSWILSTYVQRHPQLATVFDRYGLKYGGESPHELLLEEATDDDATPSAAIAHWWLNANPAIWSITDTPLNDHQTYTSHNDKGNKRRVYKYFQEVKKGDLMIGYESSPSKQIKGIFEVKQGLHNGADGREQFEFELIEKLSEPIAYEDFIRLPELKECEPVVNNQGSLFKLTSEEYEVLREFIDSKQERVPKIVRPYQYNKDPDKPFLTEDNFNHLVQQLHRKKNIVLQGPPGVGKTFIARKLAYALMGEKDNSRIEMVQFHQSTSYEDFIQGLRPSKNGGFELRNGVFYTFCQRAHANPRKDFFFIIDEINRGNLSKILGELMLLIEADKREKGYALKLTYSEGDTDTFWVPPNVYLIGTMNTADRSLAIVDYALRRRFAFAELEPDLGIPFKAFLISSGLPEALVQHIVVKLAEVNKDIFDDRDLGSGFQIGHSYFCGERNGQDASAWYNDVLKYEILPLLQEIWFDDPKKASKMFALLEQ